MRRKATLKKIKATKNTILYASNEITGMYILKAFLNTPEPEEITVNISWGE